MTASTLVLAAILAQPVLVLGLLIRNSLSRAASA